jgi:hypothetical protein
MSDELTPEERDALKNLPRERTPAAGLEERVVGAMRERGFLARRRRAIEITGGRLAGVLAASVALLIGAYSIGVHVGGDSVPLPAVATLQRDNRVVGTPTGEARQSNEAANEPAAGGAQRPAASDADKGRAAEPAEKKAPAPATPPARAEERNQALTRNLEAEMSRAAAKQEAIVSEPADAASAQGSLKAADRPRLQSAAQAVIAPKAPLTFLLNGVPILVEAPDSVRVSEDAQGRILLIYTSDGIIRIRLANER